MIPPQRRLEVLLLHMREAAEHAVSYVDGLTFDDFMRDSRTREAVAMNLIIAGETATSVSQKHPEFEAAHPEMELRHMRNMRNRIAHGYFDLDFMVVWAVVRDDLPPLVAQLDAILKSAER